VHSDFCLGDLLSCVGASDESDKTRGHLSFPSFIPNSAQVRVKSEGKGSAPSEFRVKSGNAGQCSLRKRGRDFVPSEIFQLLCFPY
jgi:hypothetical protein